MTHSRARSKKTPGDRWAVVDRRAEVIRRDAESAYLSSNRRGAGFRNR
ncbi:MAG: hypothetical protein MI923_01210 [Phycisphaerales bacterium]|nr:hypothetical protein [Phycisphaerales bacterium]